MQKNNQPKQQKAYAQKQLYVLDWYTSTYFILDGVADPSALNVGDMLVYRFDNAKHYSIGQYIWHAVDTDRVAHFVRVLEGKERKFFDEQQELALKIFPSFKKKFKATFQGSKPITARYQIFSDQLYLYFYSEERYVFTDFVKEFRSKIGKNIFLFQVGARDMVRLSHVVNEWLDIDGRPLHYSYTWQLPSIEMEDVVIQGLEWRDIERLKDWSGKLKCSMSYEADLYRQEAKNYPAKWTKVVAKKLGVEGVVLSFNIMSGEVTIKTKKNEIFRVPVGSVEKRGR